TTPTPAPTLSVVSPNTGDTGTTVTPVTLTGTNFVIGATTVAVSGSGVTVGSVTVTDTQHLTTSFTIAANAAPGARNVTVTTAGGTSGAVTFPVTQAATGFTVSPATGNIAGGIGVVITGSNFTSSNVTVKFGTTFGSGAVRLSSTQIAVFTPPHAAGA